MVWNFWSITSFISALIAIYSFPFAKWLRKRYYVRNGHAVAAIREFNGQKYCCFKDDMGIKYEVEIDNDVDVSDYLVEAPYSDDESGSDQIQYVSISYNRIDPYEISLCDEDDEEYTLEKIKMFRKVLFKLSAAVFLVSSIVFSVKLIL